MNLTVAQIIASMDESPQNWKYDRGGFCISHASGVQVWVCNGYFFYALYEPSRESWSLTDQFRFMLAFRRWKKARNGDFKIINMIRQSDGLEPI